MSAPKNLQYTKEHEWISINGKTGRMGITDYAQHALGDITFIELPKTGRTVKQGDMISTVESVKAASDIYSPVGGTIAKVNATLENSPEIVNQSPYENGWLCDIENIDAAGLTKLLSGDQYDDFVKSLGS